MPPKNLRIYFSFLLIFFCGYFSHAQQAVVSADSTVSIPNNTFSDFTLINGESIFRTYYDSTLTGLQFSSPVYKKSYAVLYTGNLGNAVLPGYLDYNLFPWKLQYGMKQFDVYDFGIAPGVVENKKIYTSLAYQRGSKKEQYFLLQHQQHFGRNLIGGLDFAAGACQGFYARQLTNLRNFDIFGMFETRNHRYRLYGKFIYNKTDAQENGGLREDSTLALVRPVDFRTLPVWLNDAERIHKEKSFYFQQQFFVFKPKPGVDSSAGPNASTYNIDVTHVFNFTDKGMTFEAASIHDDYFQNTYLDTISTFDSTHLRSYFNDLKMNLSAKNFASLDHWFDADVFLGATQEYFQINQRELDTALNDISAYAGIRLRAMDVASLMIRYNQSVNSTIKGGRKFEAAFQYNSFSNFMIMGIRYINENKVPDLFSQMNYSNHFIWFNRFDNEKINRVDFDVALPWLKFYSSLTYQQTRNFIYYDFQGLPQAYNPAINNLAVSISQQLDYRHFHLLGKAAIQTTDVPEVVRIPRYTTYISIYYEKAFFKHALLTQLGTDGRYNDQFFSPYYQPATGQFILQDQMEYGSYLFLDIFLNFKVKTARFFFKVEHLNAGWSDKNYILLAHYPMQGRMFKFGIAWNLFD